MRARQMHAAVVCTALVAWWASAVLWTTAGWTLSCSQGGGFMDCASAPDGTWHTGHALAARLGHTRLEDVFAAASAVLLAYAVAGAVLALGSRRPARVAAPAPRP